MESIKVGTRVEVCRARLTKSFHKYAELDGSKGRVVNGAAQGDGSKVGVNLEGTSRSGYREIPTAALKKLEPKA